MVWSWRVVTRLVAGAVVGGNEAVANASAGAGEAPLGARARVRDGLAGAALLQLSHGTGLTAALAPALVALREANAALLGMGAVGLQLGTAGVNHMHELSAASVEHMREMSAAGLESVRELCADGMDRAPALMANAAAGLPHSARAYEVALGLAPIGGAMFVGFALGVLGSRRRAREWEADEPAARIQRLEQDEAGTEQDEATAEPGDAAPASPVLESAEEQRGNQASAVPAAAAGNSPEREAPAQQLGGFTRDARDLGRTDEPVGVAQTPTSVQRGLQFGAPIAVDDSDESNSDEGEGESAGENAGQSARAVAQSSVRPQRSLCEANLPGCKGVYSDKSGFCRNCNVEQLCNTYGCSSKRAVGLRHCKPHKRAKRPNNSKPATP
jgi:hypothetical protein